MSFHIFEFKKFPQNWKLYLKNINNSIYEVNLGYYYKLLTDYLILNICLIISDK